MLFFVKIQIEEREAIMPKIVKFAFLVIAIIFNFEIAFGIRIGLDSGHSIKELYKSGGAFEVVVERKWNSETQQYDEKKKPYFSLAWPAGRISVVNSVTAHSGAKRKQCLRRRGVRAMLFEPSSSR